MTEGKKRPKVEKTEGINCSFHRLSRSTLGHFLPSVLFYLQSFYLRKYSIFGHFLPSVIQRWVILSSVFLPLVIQRAVTVSS